jgi:hypothetical protein
MSQLLTPHAWLAILPAPLCARSLAQVAPELVEEIAAAWSDVALTSLLLEQLLVGEVAPTLPAPAIGELLRLYEYNARCRVNDAPDTTWELPVTRQGRLQPGAACLGDRP